MFKKFLIFISSVIVLVGLLTIGVSAQTKEQAEKPAVPTVEFKTETEIFLTEISGFEYKIGDNDWQESGLFKGLSPNSEYVLYQRVAETDTKYASEASDGLTVKTDCEHRFRAANCLEHKTCTICGFVSEEVGTHNFNSSEKVIVKATAEKDGYEARKCLFCGREGNKQVVSRPYKIKFGSTYEYTGKQIKPSFYLTSRSGRDIDRKYYTSTFSNNINAGTATVKLTFKGEYYEGEMSANFTIKRRKVLKREIKMNKAEYFYNKNGVKPLISTEIYNCLQVPQSSISYTYSNNKKVGVGTVKITFSGNYKGEYTFKFNVQPKVPFTNLTLYGKSSKKFSAVSSHSIKYSVSDSKIIKYSNGKITALKNGEALLYAKSNGIYSRVLVRVRSVGLNKTKITAYTGEKYQLNVLGGTGKYTWSSSNKSIAKVSSTGKITFLKSGTCYIYAKKGKQTFKCKVTVSQYYKNVKIPDFAAVVGRLPKASQAISGIYYEWYKGITENQVKEYKKRLANSGFELFEKKKADGVMVYTYVKGERIVAVSLHKGEFIVGIV